MSAREHDLVLYGASGFVGRLVAEQLAEHAPAGLRVALGGRSQQRLERVRAGLPGEASAWPIVIADSSDAAALDALANSTRVVATTVGPYLRYGLPLAMACARAGTHYADLTGEVLYVRQLIDECQDIAERTGARIVTACGYDSIPSDLGVLLLHEQASADGAGALLDTTLQARARGGLSGGTIDSLRAQLEAVAVDPGLRRRPVRPPRPGSGPGGRAAAGRGARRPHGVPRRGDRAVGGPVRHGVLQLPDRAAQQRAAGPRLRQPLPLPGGQCLRHRTRAASSGPPR